MTRRLLNLLTALSLLLSVAVVAVWLRSHVAFDQVSVRPGSSLRVLHVWWSDGSIACGLTEGVEDHGLAPYRAQWRSGLSHDLDADWRRQPATTNAHAAGFGYLGTEVWPALRPRGRRVFAVLAPLWSLVLLLLATSTPCCSGRLRRWRRARRASRGLCPACGYDLRANVSGVCPECGTQAPG